MKYESIIRTESEDAGEIIASIKPELDKNVSKRSNIEIRKDEHGLKIQIEAEDVNALRASINNVLRLIKASEKSLKIEKELIK